MGRKVSVVWGTIAEYGAAGRAGSLGFDASVDAPGCLLLPLPHTLCDGQVHIHREKAVRGCSK